MQFHQSDPLLKPAQAAEYIGVTENTLSVWRCVGRYSIPFIKVGRLVRYRKSALDLFLSAEPAVRVKGNEAPRLPASAQSPCEGFQTRPLAMAIQYYREQGLKLTGGGEWKTALCPLHRDTRPSLLVHLVSGAFRCRVCHKHGGDVLSFHMQRYGLRFREAAKQLGAWGTRR